MSARSMHIERAFPKITDPAEIVFERKVIEENTGIARVDIIRGGVRRNSHQVAQVLILNLFTIVDMSQVLSVDDTTGIGGMRCLQKERHAFLAIMYRHDSPLRPRSNSKYKTV